MTLGVKTEHTIPSRPGCECSWEKKNGEEQCLVCDLGLTRCTVCGGAESSMPTDCPGTKMTEAEEAGVTAGVLDFLQGGWAVTGRRVNPSVVRPWVSTSPLKVQTVILCGLRGCDGFRKEDPSKPVVRWLRSVVLRSAVDPEDRGDEPLIQKGQTFMTGWDSVAVDKFTDDLDPYPIHWVMHLLHAAQGVLFFHPDRDIQSQAYAVVHRITDALHIHPESKSDYVRRLTS